MTDQWVLLTPAGVVVESFVSPAVEVPTLTTRRELESLALAVATLLEQGLPADLGAMLRARSRPQVHPGQQQLPMEAEYRPPAQVETFTHGCACGKIFDSQLKLREHQRDCGLYRGAVLIPEDRKVD
jgi:hypothetical protein